VRRGLNLRRELLSVFDACSLEQGTDEKASRVWSRRSPAERKREKNFLFLVSRQLKSNPPGCLQPRTARCLGVLSVSRDSGPTLLLGVEQAGVPLPRTDRPEGLSQVLSPSNRLSGRRAGDEGRSAVGSAPARVTGVADHRRVTSFVPGREPAGSADRMAPHRLLATVDGARCW